jgi:hypothetical protein
MKQWLTSNTPFIRNALQLAKRQLKQNASNIRQFMPNAPITVKCSKTKTKRRKPKTKSKDIRQFGQTQTLQAKVNQPPNPQQARILYPKLYKQASIFEYTTRKHNMDHLNMASLTI